MSFTITTWNINSIRLRLEMVLGYLRHYQPDVLCLQEIKCPTDLFPSQAFADLGYKYSAINGQKGYHGVAILSRLALDSCQSQDFCLKGDSRHICATLAVNGRQLRLHNFYVPAGGDIPDSALNPKFAHKLQFIDEMQHIKADMGDGYDTILVGDLNIAPGENDVWSHKQLLKIVSHTPPETEGLNKVLQAGAWADLMRIKFPEPEKLYTWWSYRARDWQASNRGRRLDHIWSSQSLVAALEEIEILRAYRSFEKPSDHVPVSAKFSL